MKNPKIVKGKTPHGGDYAELYFLTKDGELAKDKKEAVMTRLLERKKDGSIVYTINGTIS